MPPLHNRLSSPATFNLLSTASVSLRDLPYAHERVRPAPQHHLLQVPDPGPVTILRRREDPASYPPYVVLVEWPVDGLPVEDGVLGSVHRHGCLTCPSVPVGSMLRRHRLTRHTSACFHSRAPGPVSSQLYERRPVEDRSQRFRFPVAFQLPAFASWASCSRSGIGLSLRSAYHDTTKTSWTQTGFPRFTRMRYGWVGCPLYPGGDGVPTAIEASLAVVCRLSAAGLLSLSGTTTRPEELP
jgi:hypothetical protein